MILHSPKAASRGTSLELRHQLAGLLFGLWLAVVPVKFGNPVIFDHILEVPSNVDELLIWSWPVAWSYVALGVVAVAAALVWRWKVGRPGWLLALPLAWFGWTLLSATQTVDGRLTQVALLQFAGCVVCFFAGVFGLSELQDLRPVWVGLALGLVVILGTALEQHFGGLERTRIAFENLPPEIRAPFDTPEFRRKILSDRIWGTFIYPNALAGGVLLLLPVTLAGLRQLGRNAWFKWGLGGGFMVAALAVLYWSGSKSGWLIALTMAGLALCRLPATFRLKATLFAALLVVGGLAFIGRHSSYFERGASSLAARADYWRAAGQMIRQRPILGYGPGTFMRQYAVLKAPEAEMARLAHNDYLQQGCDTGLPAMLFYGGFIVATLLLLFRHASASGVQFPIWLGVFAFAAQGFSEFGLYIPALAWPCFLFAGWLWGLRMNEFDKPPSPSYSPTPKK
jgi:O-antigen ligase